LLRPFSKFIVFAYEKALISTLDGHSAIVKAAKCIFDAVKPLLTHNLYKIGTVVGGRAFQRGGGGTGGNFPRAPSLRGAPKFAKLKKNNFELFLYK
jgi:hypothetical protein